MVVTVSCLPGMTCPDLSQVLYNSAHEISVPILRGALFSLLMECGKGMVSFRGKSWWLGNQRTTPKQGDDGWWPDSHEMPVGKQAISGVFQWTV